MHDKYYIGKPGHTGWILPYTVYVAGLRLAGKINQLLESPKLGIQVPRARYTFQYLLGPHFKTPENPSNIFAEKSNICTSLLHATSITMLYDNDWTLFIEQHVQQLPWLDITSTRQAVSMHTILKHL